MAGKLIIEKKLYQKKIDFAEDFFLKNFFRLMGGIKYLDFFRLMVLSLNVCLIQKYGSKILNKKNLI